MARNSCVYFPRGRYKQELFTKLKADFGHNMAAHVFNRVTHPSFTEAYKDSLILNEGVPTYESVMSNDAVINFIGKDAVLQALNAKQPHLEDSLENVEYLINEAYKYNNDENNRRYVAYVDHDDEDKLTLIIAPRTSDNIDVAENQFKIQKLNERISSFLSPIGITMGILSDEEVAVGRVGKTDFSQAVATANGLASMMAIANNLEGFNAISEEFSHFIVGVYRKDPLVSRSIEVLKDQDVAREVLGDQYESVSKYYNGNESLIAEEALGHVLKATLTKDKTPADNNQATHKYKSLFRRAIDYIVGLFKGYNPSYIQSSIDYVNSNMGELVKDLVDGKKTITKKDVAESQREATFNALSEKADAQIDVLKGIEQRSYKKALLQQNFEDATGKTVDYEKRAAKMAAKVHKTLKQNFAEEETVAAIAAYLGLATKDLKKLYSDLMHIEDLATNDRFILLKNVLTNLQCYQPTIKELKDITESSYLDDKHIKSQRFVIGDAASELRKFETDEYIEPVDTSEMSIKDIVGRMITDSQDIALSSDESFYISKKTGARHKRVTQIISVGKDEDVFDNKNPWHTPSTNVGTGTHEFVEDFLTGRIKSKKVNGQTVYAVEGKDIEDVYPNATKEDLYTLAKNLEGLVANLQKEGISIVANELTVNGIVTSLDSQGQPHKINVAGSIDLLGVDKDGNWYIYDIKTYHSQINDEKKAKYAQQVTLYKDFLEKKYGIKVKGMRIIPIKVNYPTPRGATYNGKVGRATYTVNSEKPEGYNGKKGNQLNIDGKPFKGAKPTMDSKGIMELQPKKTTINYGQLGGEEGNVNVNNTLDALVAVDRLYTQIENEFNRISPKYLADFFRGFVGENVKVREVDEKTGKLTGELVEVSVDELIAKAPKDSNVLQKWLITMADNPDAFLQIYSKIYTDKMHEKRFKMIKKSQEILALGKEYEKKGITSYDWMFESDKKNYIMHYEVNGVDYSYDRSAYEKAKADYLKALNEKYGEFPEIGSKEFEEKNNALIKWMNDNTIEIEVDFTNNKGKTVTRTQVIPSPSKFPSKYRSLTSTQKEFYEKWMAIKEELDYCLPKDATTTLNTIKIRKSGYERLKDTLHGNGIAAFTEAVKAKFLQSFDDENNYSKGMRGFANEEVMKLPLFYINAEDTSDITTDVIGSLVAYADMAYNYEAMDSIVNPLEIGRFLAKSRQVSKVKRGKQAVENLSFGNISISNPLYEDNTSNFMYLLNDFMESKIYQKHLKDAGTIEVKDKSIENQKLASQALKLGSTVQLGFNALAGLANIATGTAMQRIEGIAGEFFNTRELAKADVEFGKASAAFLGDIGQRIKKSKLSLFDDMFDVRQGFTKNIRHNEFINKNLLLKIFGPGFQYICQDAGDHWMYNRSAIAIALKYKLKDGNNQISLWDALEVVPIDKDNPELGNKLVLKKGVTKLDGSAFTEDDIAEISDRIKFINQRCFGVYNQEDSIAARRTILGRFVMQYRDWIPAQMNHRFGAKTTNLNKGENAEVEGYYRTFGRFIGTLISEMKNGEMNLKQCFNELDDYEKANIKRAIAEIFQLMGIYIIAGLLKRSKKKDREYSWARNTLGYLFTREKTELGALVPVVQMGELINIVKSPAAATSVVSDLYNLRLLLNPVNYFDEIQSGDYKGHSSAYRAFMRSPLTLYYRTIKRQLKPQKAEQFYK